MKKATAVKMTISAAAITLALGAFASTAHAYDSAVCGTYAAYTGKSAAYQPGVDARGKAVAPADLSATMAGMGDVVRIPMTVNMEQRLSTMMPNGVELKAPAGMIDIYRDGRVMYNGVDITTQTNVLCREKPVMEKPAPKKKAAKKPDPKPVVEVEAAVIEETPAATERPLVEVITTDSDAAPINALDPVVPQADVASEQLIPADSATTPAIPKLNIEPPADVAAPAAVSAPVEITPPADVSAPAEVSAPAAVDGMINGQNGVTILSPEHNDVPRAPDAPPALSGDGF